MSEDEREDHEDVAWLLARERGQPGPAVSPATEARYAWLQGMIADLPATPAGVTARTGWEQDVLAAIDAEEAAANAPSRLVPVESSALAPAPSPTPSPAPSSDVSTPVRMRTRLRRRAAVTAAFAMAAVAVILVTVSYDSGRGSDGTMAAPLVTYEVMAAGSRMRGADPSVGDTLIVRAEIEGPGELRVYDKAGTEQAHCAALAPDCAVEVSGTRTTLRLTMQLRVMGMLHAILFTAPLGRPSGGIDADIEAAMRAGIGRIPRDLVDVR